MSTEDTSGPAFPTENAHQSGSSTWHYEGMTLRDYFAAKALQGQLSRSSANYCSDEDHAERAYMMADSMLKARQA